MGEEAKPEEAKVEATAAPVEEKKEAKEKPAEEKTPAAGEEKPAEEPQPPPPFILYVDLHCVGCAKKIERAILKIRGVEGVVMDMDKNQVTIKGVVEPHAVCNKIMKKTKRKARVLSPAPAADGEPLPPVVASQVTGVTTVELNVNMHCEACANQLKKKILKMRGVQTAATELSTGKVTVTGTMDAEKLVDYVYRRTRKQARIVPQPDPEPKAKAEPEKEAEKPAEEESKGEEKPAEAGEEKKDEGKEEEAKTEGGAAAAEDGGGEEAPAVTTEAEEEGMKRMIYYYQPLYVIERIPPPQLFSDENPNACCIS